MTKHNEATSTVTETLNSLLAKGLMTELDYMTAEEAAEAIELEARLMAERSAEEE